MENIHIIDDFFNKNELIKIIDYFNKKKWNCNSIDNSNMDLSTDSPFWRIELKDEFIFNDYLKNKIENIIKKKIILVRMYSVGQMYAENGNYHIESDTNENTFVLYINSNYKEENDGHFIIKIPNDNIILAIEPQYNRGVLFPSKYRHKGMGYNRNMADFRICIAWKFKILT